LARLCGCRCAVSASTASGMRFRNVHFQISDHPTRASPSRALLYAVIKASDVMIAID
jgi:hypothetical protein